MYVVILMAGAGQRFAAEAARNPLYSLPKPMIPVLGRPIVEWTTRSLPFISHHREDVPAGSITVPDRDLFFAVRTEDVRAHAIDVAMREIYGEGVQFTLFDEITRGNLETAFVVSKNLAASRELLILDSDNAYDGSLLLEFIHLLAERPCAAVCSFEPFDDSAKWCFAVANEHGRVTALLEKDPTALSRGGLPMVGSFYFDSVQTFRGAAEQIIASGRTTGRVGAGEFYMSQAVQHLLEQGVAVYAHHVDRVVPMGTPEDVEHFIAREIGK